MSENINFDIIGQQYLQPVKSYLHYSLEYGQETDSVVELNDGDRRYPEFVPQRDTTWLQTRKRQESMPEDNLSLHIKKINL